MRICLARFGEHLALAPEHASDSKGPLNLMRS